MCLRVDVDRGGVLGKVGVVGAETFDAFARAPGLEVAQVLAQAIGEHLRAFGQRARLRVVAHGRAHRIADDQAAFERTVEQLVLLRPAQAAGMRQPALPPPHACPPLRGPPPSPTPPPPPPPPPTPPPPPP